MNAFIVELENRPGAMARVTEQLAERGVNILVYGLGIGQRGAIGFVASDEQTARAVLSEDGVAYQEVPVLHVRMENRPGQAAAASRRLEEAGVNITMWLPVDTRPDRFTVAVGVDDTEAARGVLAGQLTDFADD